MISAQWNKQTPGKDVVKKNSDAVYYHLDINKIRTQLLRAQKIGDGSGVTIEIPMINGKIEKFSVNSFPVMDEILANQ